MLVMSILVAGNTPPSKLSHYRMGNERILQGVQGHANYDVTEYLHGIAQFRNGPVQFLMFLAGIFVTVNM